MTTQQEETTEYATLIKKHSLTQKQFDRRQKALKAVRQARKATRRDIMGSKTSKAKRNSVTKS